MPTPAETVESIAGATSLNERVQRIRKIGEQHGTGEQTGIYAALADQLYVPLLTPDFAYTHWSDLYELSDLVPVYDRLVTATDTFENVSEDDLTAVLTQDPATLRVLRLITGLLIQEFAAATVVPAEQLNVKPLTVAKVKTLEASRNKPTTEPIARLAARTIDQVMTGALFPAPDNPQLRLKTDKPDTVAGWETVRAFATYGVPYSTFLHQRHYGGTFRQLLDATSGRRGDVLEDAVEAAFRDAGLAEDRWVRTGAGGQQKAVPAEYGLTVQQAPDFFIFDADKQFKAMIECKGANDGGTARDKAARFARLRELGTAHGGVPVFAVLSGLGWRRVNDTMGPVVRNTEGRVFTLANLAEMVKVAPFPDLLAT